MNGLVTRLKYINGDFVKALKGKNIAVTGTLKNYTRQQIIETINKIGAHYKTSVTGQTNYLIVGDIAWRTTKHQAAEKKGIQIISEKDFEELREAVIIKQVYYELLSK